MRVLGKVHIALIVLISIFLSSCGSKQIKVACVGDSITEGFGLKSQSKSGYPVILDQLLGDEYTVLNFGRSATTLSQSGDFPYWIAKEFSNVFASNPDIIVIKLGTNDTKPWNWSEANYEQSYQALIDTFNTISSHPKIIVCKPVPVFESNWNADSPERGWGINDSTVTAGVIPLIEKIAKKNNLPIIDLYTSMQGQNESFPDGIHPNEIGAQTMAGIIATSIKE